jgi:hypothetical protein
VFSAPKACIVIATEDDIIEFLWGGEVIVTKLFLRVKVCIHTLTVDDHPAGLIWKEQCGVR